MKHLYEINAFDVIMGEIVSSRYESDDDMSKEEIIKRWNLDSPDIRWYNLYDTVNGVKRMM